MSTQPKFCIYFTEINTLPFFGAPKLPLIPKVSPLPNSKKLFYRLSVWDGELLSAPKIMTFLAKLLPKFHSPFQSNAISYPLYTYLLLSSSFPILHAPNKQFFNAKFLSRIFGQQSKW